MMTIKVYWAESRTGRRFRSRATAAVHSGNPERLPDSLALPPCLCPRCTAAR